MEFTFQFGEAENRHKNKIKQNIQYNDVAMEIRKLKQRAEIRNLNKMAREGLKKVIFE